MIDWLTLRINSAVLTDGVRERLTNKFGRMIAISKEGEIDWSSPRRETLRSDTHTISICMGSDLEVSGSPARIYDSNNVFGSDDIPRQARAMLQFVRNTLLIPMPELSLWRCTRIDITYNYDMGSESSVRESLRYLDKGDGGRYQKSNSHQTIYWQKTSKYHAGKAYAKGHHLRYMVKREKAKAEDWQLIAADRLLRLEYTLRAPMMKKLGINWLELSQSEVKQLHCDYFTPLIGRVEVYEMNELELIQHIIDNNSVSELQARKAFQTWQLIKAIGLDHAQGGMSNGTFYRHKNMLTKAGLGLADLSSGEIIPLKKRVLVLDEPVTDWNQLKAVN